MTKQSTKHIVLVGLMGSGKSTVARRLGDRLDRPVLDSDDMIEELTGKSVRQIFADQGEQAFREQEQAVLASALANEQAAVIAAAGGVVLSAANRGLLDEADAVVIWLRAGPDVLQQRVRTGGHRPLLDDDPRRVLAKMHADRQPLYEEVADFIVDVDGRSVDEVVTLVLGGPLGIEETS